MSFTSTVVYQNVVGTEREIRGTYTNTAGSTGGEVVTGLSEVRDFKMNPYGSVILASQSVTNETFPLNNSTGSVTVVNNADESGTWTAKGL